MKHREAPRLCVVLVAGIASAGAGHGQTLNTIYSFGQNDNGCKPESGVAIGAGGVLYGTLSHCGAAKLGAVYQLTPPASPGGDWTESLLHTFTNKGGGPSGAGVTIGPAGGLYGTTYSGGPNDGGTVFRLTPPVNGGTPWDQAILHAFPISANDGFDARADPAFAPDGALYGTAGSGGGGTAGMVYRLAPPGANGGPWSEQVLYRFTGHQGDGSTPAGPLVFGANGTVFGTTMYGGSTTAGTFFQLTPPSKPGGPWAESILYDFDSQPGESLYPNGIVQGPGGVLYGTLSGGTVRNCNDGCGAVFQLTPPASPGGSWTQTILHSFTGPLGDGQTPNSPPVLGPGGVLYGTTYDGGAYGPGTIYEMIPPAASGGTWTELVLYSFTGGADGSVPVGVALGPDGNLYGATQIGGVSNGGVTNMGTVFQLMLQ